MSEPGAPLPAMRAMAPRHLLQGLGREGIAIVVVVALVTSVNTTVKFLVSVPLGQWFDAFLGDFAAHLFVGSVMLMAAVWARNAVSSPGARQYLATLLAVVVAAILADLCVEAWNASGPLFGSDGTWQIELILLGSPIVRYSFVGLIIASTWLYVRAEADHAAAIETCAVDAERMDRETAEARLQMLEAQIEPHFLFNTLANVRRLYETDRTSGAMMMRNLEEYLAVALPHMRTVACTLGRESDHAAAYLNIQKIRMGRRLAFAFDVPPELRDARMPPLMLLTLVENSVRHGLTPLPEGGRIDVRARVADGRLRVDVADTGQGFTQSGGGGTGLANTRARLASYYGERAGLSLALNGPRGVVATLVLPYEAVCDGRRAP
jgi:signal transduction histidine kinase